MAEEKRTDRHRIRFLHIFMVGLCVLLAASVLYSNLARRRGITGVKEETPANNVRTLLMAALAYQATYKMLPPTLSSLGPPPGGQQESATNAGLIDARLASGTKNSYVYRYIPTAGSQSERFESFTITADPIGTESPDRPHYFSDQTAVVRVETGRAATVASPRDEWQPTRKTGN